MSDYLLVEDMIPIDDAAKNGEPCLVCAGDEYAAAYWTGDMWAYQVPEGGAVEQIDIEPTHYKQREIKSAFFRRFSWRETEKGE